MDSRQVLLKRALLADLCKAGVGGRSALCGQHAGATAVGDSWPRRPPGCGSAGARFAVRLQPVVSAPAQREGDARLALPAGEADLGGRQRLRRRWRLGHGLQRGIQLASPADPLQPGGIRPPVELVRRLLLSAVKADLSGRQCCRRRRHQVV